MSALRFVIFVSGMLRFIAAATALHLFFRDPKMRRERILKLVSRSGMRLLRTINVQVKIQGVLPARAGSEGRLIVSNHISYLDVAVLASFFNARFVTSTEVQRMPGLGFICTLAECQFVSRHSLARLRTDLANLRETLSSGTDVLVFPEATSSRGTEILPFHRGLLNVGAKRMIPCVVGYSRPEAAYVDDDEFLSHLWRLTKIRNIVAWVTILPERQWTEETDLRVAATQLHQEMSISKANQAL